MLGQSTNFSEPLWFMPPNPFIDRFVGQCTWYCWTKAHIKATKYPERHLNVAQIPTNNAGIWATVAEKNGYHIGDIPKADSIACWSGGHVSYVELWDSNTSTITFSEANWYVGANPMHEIVVPANVKDEISENVAKINKSIIVKSITVGQNGTDGMFKEASLEAFRKRKSGTLKFIYLN